MRPRNPEIELKVVWSKRENGVMIYYPSKKDGNFMYGLLSTKIMASRFTDEAKKDGNRIVTNQDWNPLLCIVQEPSFLEQLDTRGYDLSTLKISIRKKDSQR